MKMKHYFLSVLFFLFTIGVNQKLHAQTKMMNTAEISAFTKKLDQVMLASKSLSADFKQKKEISFMDKPVLSSGKFRYQAPSAIRWEYVAPEKQVLQFSDNELVIEAKGKTKKVDLTKNRMYREINDLIISSMQGSKLFDTEKSEISYFRSPASYLIILKPKDKRSARYIQKIELEFDDKSFYLNKLKIVEASNDFTEINFQNQVTNNSLSLL